MDEWSVPVQIEGFLAPGTLGRGMRCTEEINAHTLLPRLWAGPRELPGIDKQHRAIMKAGSCHPSGLRAFSSSASRPGSLVDQLQFLYNCQSVSGVCGGQEQERTAEARGCSDRENWERGSEDGV